MNQDKNILEGLLRNQADAQRRLLQQYGERVFAQIVRIIPCQEDAEEVYQDVFLKAFRHVDSYRAERASLSTWLLRIAYHEALNFARGKRLPCLSLENFEPNIGKLPGQDVDVLMNRTDEETILLMEQALQQLHPKEQSLIGMSIMRIYLSRRLLTLRIRPQPRLPHDSVELDKKCIMS